MTSKKKVINVVGTLLLFACNIWLLSEVMSRNAVNATLSHLLALLFVLPNFIAGVYLLNATVVMKQQVKEKEQFYVFTHILIFLNIVSLILTFVNVFGLK